MNNFQLINPSFGKIDNPGFLICFHEVMDQIIDQMAQAGLKDKIIELGNSIKPKN